VRVCPSCGRENAEDARFCSACGTPLEPESRREERKVVSVLFCDLVGFTARAESMDPEDVRRLLQPYHARLRSELERFGGTVEKFIGDAVMAVFGAPTAHEDDPERAVRAALAIRDALEDEGDLEIRIGITTGEALIALGARPEIGEGMASGDVVNTAARIQGAAPIGSILVDETTYRAAERVIEFASAQPIEAKGKTMPVPVWQAVRARARVGVERVGGAALVGREQELTLLRETFSRVVRENAPQLVTLVGVPGIGKSRLVYELFRTAETGAFGRVYWRSGRSLPYGEGVSFWALSEMVKAQAGILESDTPAQTDEKLRRAVEAAVPDAADANWVARHLRPLAGLESDEAWIGDRRDESFAAWRRFFETLAETQPLVLVFEDLHWADDALLDFVDYFLDWASGVPILAICSARPELLARRPGWGGGKVNSSTILVSPLSEEETASLVHALLGRSAIDADVRAQLLDHSSGNPLYAEEFTRMLAARPGETVLPETVHGIIAARLDTLPTAEKDVLQNAAVLGKVFWLGALGEVRSTLEKRLHSLLRKEFVGRNRRSSVAGEEEYVFRHALVRDVAYEQIPKSKRAEKHRRVAEWIDSLGRTEDHAEMLAHHYAEALDYARSAGQETGLFAERARAALREAGNRALALNAFEQAVRFYDRSLDLSPGEGRGELLLQLGRALHLAASERARDVLDQAVEALVAARDLEAAAEAEVLLAIIAFNRAQRDRSLEHLARAFDLVEHGPPSPAKARVLAEVARHRMLVGEYVEAVRIGREAEAMAEELGLDEVLAGALNTVGTARSNQGDQEGRVDVERSLEIALAAGSWEAQRSYNNLGANLYWSGDLRRATGYYEQAMDYAVRVGDAASVRFQQGSLVDLTFHAGRWEDAHRYAAQMETSSTNYADIYGFTARALMWLASGEGERAASDAARGLEVGRSAKDAQVLLLALGAAARVEAEVGTRDRADLLVSDHLSQLQSVTPSYAFRDLVWVALRLQRALEAREALEAHGTPGNWLDACRAALDGAFEEAADLYERIGSFPNEAEARLRAGERLLGEGRIEQAEGQLARALEFYRGVGATAYARATEELLLGADLEIPA
jgi:class 3 adenylate cyclase/tetratricopeptide (TPR) repeat protein